MQTYSGRGIDVYHLPPEHIEIIDIANALSMICRYGGHCKFHYSVAQHSLIVAENIPKPYGIFGLMHDAAEAYLGDMIRPLKKRMKHFQQLEGQVLGIICLALDIHVPWNYKIQKMVKQMDQQALYTESFDVMGGMKFDWGFAPEYKKRFKKIEPCRIAEVKHDFLMRFKDYQEEWNQHVQKGGS